MVRCCATRGRWTNRPTLGYVLIGGMLAGVAFLLGPAPTRAQPKPADKKHPPPPQIVFSDPLAITPGSTTKLKLRGLHLDTITDLSVGEPRSTGKILGNSTKATVPNNLPAKLYGDNQIEVEVTLPADVAGATVTITVTGPGGTSKAHRLIVNDDTPRLVAKKGRISGFAQAMALPQFPVVVEGQIEASGVVDVYSFTANEGEQFTFEIQAARFGVPLDSILTIYDEQARQLAYNDDFADSVDSQIRFTAPRTGTFYVVVTDAHDLGGPTHLYRLLARRD